MSKFQYDKSQTLLAFNKLIELYKKIPDTKGCLENINKEGGCGGWCCRIQTPLLFYCEFLRILNHVNKNWSPEELCDLIEKALRLYLKDDVNKGCIFWDENTKLCRIHTVRPMNCYLYGIMPDSEFNMRLEKLRKQFEDNFFARFKEQCDLVSAVDGKEVTEDDTNKWFDELVKIEALIGIPPNVSTSEEAGTYLTPHDHLMIYLLSDYQLENFSKVRKFGKPDEKEQLVQITMGLIRKALLGSSQPTEKEEKNGAESKNS